MITEEQKNAIRDVIQVISTYTSGRRVLSTMFNELPDEEAWEEYYQVIPEPRCLNDIKVAHVLGLSEYK
jgi:chromatin structure-remodeling complex subunit RSC1/2